MYYKLMVLEKNSSTIHCNSFSSENDKKAGFTLSKEFKRFNQRNDIFTRAFWDKLIKNKDTELFFSSYRNQPTPKNSIGFKQKDFALRNASWSVSDIISNRNTNLGLREGFQSIIQNDTPIAKTKIEINDIEVFTKEIKKIAKLFGADLVGITPIDERWHYSHYVNTLNYNAIKNNLPKSLKLVIVLGHSMNKDLVDTYPSALAGASTGLEYSKEASIVTLLTSYIKGLGYAAMGSMNDTALVIPYAIKAGLGEYARNQMVITPEFGPRVRFSKIFTDLPLITDEPKKFGITEFCNICNKCAVSCPPKAIPFGEPEFSDNSSISNIKGVKKWTANCEKCFGYWSKIKTDCAICMRVCPFNRDYKNIEAKIFWRIATSFLRKLAYWWDKHYFSSKRVRPSLWWKSL